MVQPYRGEGFCLPVAGAMACARPVIVTGYGPTLDYCTDETTYLLPCRVERLADKQISGMETVDLPFLAVPAEDMLRQWMRHVFEHPDEARVRGLKAREHVRAGWTWAHAAVIAERRLANLRDRRPVSILNPASDGGRPKVSLMMIVKNEEQNLAACLTSVAGLFDEIVITDTGSTDRTVEIARQFGAKLLHFTWIDHFAAARNVSMQHATAEWLFWMDADDRLDDVNREKLRQLLDNLPQENVAFVVNCLCLPDETGVSTEVTHVRLFRHQPGLAWEHRIHEQILPSLRRLGVATTPWSDVTVNHVGYVDTALRKQKLQRDRRLLELEYAEIPEHPFTLFNMGNSYMDEGRLAEAVEFFRASLRHSASGDSIVRKLYTLIANCEFKLGRPADALATCREGRAYYSDDADIQLQESVALRGIGELAAAIDCLKGLIAGSDTRHFGSVATGLRGYLARTNLASYLVEAGRRDEARAQFRQALAEQPRFVKALFGLGDLCMAARDWAGLQEVVATLQTIPQAAAEAEVFRGRAHQARQEFAAARAVLEAAIQAHPLAFSPRLVLSQVLLQEGRDLAATEQALRAVLAMDPAHAESRQNLDVLLLRQQGRKAV